MPAQWTGELLCKMHVEKVLKQELAECLGYTPEYVSAVLNGKREPKNAEEKFNSAFEELINKRKKITPNRSIHR